jgi:DNA-binding transcriptional ArsR family regulator
MSVRVMALVWENELIANPTDRFVLLALADRADEDGFCWPSIGQLVQKTKLTDRAVQQSLKRLRDIGVVKLLRKGGTNGSKRIANRYQIVLVPPGERRSPGEPHSPVKELHRTGERGSPPPVKELHPIHHKNTSITTTTRARYSGTPASDDAAEDELLLFSELAQEFGLSADRIGEVRRVAEAGGIDRVERAAILVRSGEFRNVGAAFMTALRKDWLPAIRSQPTSIQSCNRKRLPEPDGWREWMVSRGFAAAQLPANFDELFRRYNAEALEFLRSQNLTVRKLKTQAEMMEVT